MCPAFFLLIHLCVYSCPAQSADINLGYLYIQSGPGAATNWGASWVQESFSQFKLGILDVNADQSILPNHTLRFKIANTAGDGGQALKGAISLVDDVVGIIGTGYSSALSLPGGYCSVFNKPMVSPGSTMLSLIDKSSMPYVLRSIASDSGILKAMVAIIYDLGWRNSVVMVNKNFEDGAIQVLRPAMLSSGIGQLTLVYDDPDDSSGNPIEANQKDLEQKMQLIKSSGYRIIALYGKTVDMHALNRTSTDAGVGFWSMEHVWVMSSSAWAGKIVHHALQAFAPGFETPTTARKAWYNARWSSVTTLWDASIHGGYDPTTGLPFFGVNATTDYTVWDTDYAQKGDGASDMWGEYVYDTVWLYAHAMHAMLVAGKDIHNGQELRNQLLQTRFEGVSGNLVFDMSSQDRIERTVIYMSSPNGDFKIGNATEHLGNWDLTGPCSDGCTTLTPQSVAFPAGRIPSDGRYLDLQTSFFSVGADYYREGDTIKIIVQVRNSFRQVPCQSLCSTDLNSTGCSSCLGEFADYSKLVPIFETPAGQILQSALPLVYDVQVLSGTLRISSTTGLVGSSEEDREVIVKLTYKSVLFDRSYELQLTSTACLAGFYADRDVCVQCPAGNFTASRGSVECGSCEAGSYQDELGSTACKICTPGHFQSQRGASFCERCEIGSHVGIYNASACIKCPGIRTTQFLASTSEEQCLCDRGHFSVHPQASCELCPDGMDCNIGSDLTNWFNKDVNMDLPAEVPSNYPLLQARHYSSPSDPMSVFRCLTDVACPGGDPGNCGHAMEGTACGRCLDGYFRTEDGLCHKCNGFESSTALFPIIPALFGPIIVSILYFKGRDDLELWSSPGNIISSVIFLTLMYIQTLALINTCYLVKPPVFSDGSGWTTLFLDVLSLLRPDCSVFNDFTATFIGKLFLPVGVAFVFVVTLLGSRFAAKFHPSLLMDSDIVFNSYMGVYQMFFLTVAQQSLALFQCYQHVNGEWSLRSQADVLCYVGLWKDLVAVAVISILIFCVAAVALFAYVIMTAHRNFQQLRFRRRWKFLFIRYRPSIQWWALLLLARGIWLNCATILFDKGTQQLCWLLVGMLGYMVLSLIHYPWRSMLCAFLDVAMHSVTVLLFAFLPFFAFPDESDANDDDYAVSYLTVATVPSCFIVVILLTLAWMRLTGQTVVHWSEFTVAQVLHPYARLSAGGLSVEQRDEFAGKVCEAFGRLSDPAAVSLVLQKATCYDYCIIKEALSVISSDFLFRGHEGKSKRLVSMDVYKQPKDHALVESLATATLDNVMAPLQSVQSEVKTDAKEEEVCKAATNEEQELKFKLTKKVLELEMMDAILEMERVAVSTNNVPASPRNTVTTHWSVTPRSSATPCDIVTPHGTPPLTNRT